MMRDIKTLDVRVSKGQKTKLGVTIPSVSMIPVKDCGNCDYCRELCYALKAWRMYKETRAAWTANSRAFREDPYSAVMTVYRWLARKRKLPRFFRIHVAADFLNQDHVDAWAMLAREFPTVKFLAFTKMHHLDFSACPENLQIVHSMWPGMPDTAPKNARRAWVQDGTETRIPADAIECAGKCDDCGMCWSLKAVGHDVWFHVH